MNRLLLVEDETSVSTPLQSYLHKEGFHVSVVNTLQAANAALISGANTPHTDLVLLDWMLPDG